MGLSIVMPALGESVTEATVNRWLKQVGDRIDVGEPLVEVSTDKVDTEVASPAAGVIESLLVREDETVEIGTPIAILADPDGDVAADVAPAVAASPPPETVADTPVADAPVAAAAAREPRPSGPFRSPLVRRLLAQYSIDPSTLVGTGANGRIRRDDVLAAAGAATPSVTPPPRTPAASRVLVTETTAALSASPVSASVIEVDVTRLEHGRQIAGESAPVSVIDEVGAAVGEVLDRFPALTARVDDDRHIGGALTISTTGSYATLWHIPALPESSPAALSVGAVTRRAVVLTDAGEDRIAVRSMVYLALAFDPRAVDGDEAAGFLVAVKARLESDAPARP